MSTRRRRPSALRDQTDKPCLNAKGRIPLSRPSFCRDETTLQPGQPGGWLVSTMNTKSRLPGSQTTDRIDEALAIRRAIDRVPVICRRLPYQADPPSSIACVLFHKMSGLLRLPVRRDEASYRCKSRHRRRQSQKGACTLTTATTFGSSSVRTIIQGLRRRPIVGFVRQQWDNRQSTICLEDCEVAVFLQPRVFSPLIRALYGVFLYLVLNGHAGSQTNCVSIHFQVYWRCV